MFDTIVVGGIGDLPIFETYKPYGEKEKALLLGF